MPFITANDAHLYYSEYGAGEPLVLLHHFLATGETSWRKQIPALAASFRVIVPDLRGHGRSDNPGAQRLTHTLLAHDVIALLQALGITNAHFAGVSSGAMLLLTLALSAPTLARSLLLTAATYRFTPINRERSAQFLPERLPPAWAAHWQEIHAPIYGPDYWQELLAAFVALNQEWGEVNFPAPAHLSHITQPVRIIHGDRDEYFPPVMAVELFNLLPAASLCILPNAGHLPHIQYPERWNDLALEFFAQKGPVKTDESELSNVEG